MKKKIMLVDDTPDTLEVTQEILILKGYEVKSFDNSLKAFDELQKNRFIPDLLLLDMRMPGLDGPTFCDKLRKSEHTKHIRVAFFTASGDLDKKALEKKGVLGYVYKPYTIDGLVKQIEGYLKKKAIL